jgi:hypothetical protein
MFMRSVGESKTLDPVLVAIDICEIASVMLAGNRLEIQRQVGACGGGR